MEYEFESVSVCVISFWRVSEYLCMRKRGKKKEKEKERESFDVMVDHLRGNVGEQISRGAAAVASRCSMTECGSYFTPS